MPGRLPVTRDNMVEKKKRGLKKTTMVKKPAQRWSARVTETSDAMTLEKSVFKKSPRAIALSLKRSAEKSHRRKSGPFRSAMSMLTFYINRAGKHLSAARRRTLEAAKDKLRAAFGRKAR